MDYTQENLKIYHNWHNAVVARDLDRTAKLYASDAIFETPLVLAVYPEARSGVIHGRDNIEKFLKDSIKQFSSDLAEWFRTDICFINGEYLTWEYPRETPNGEQVDLVEMMRIKDAQIVEHRVYWGWYGMQKLLNAMQR